MLKLITSIVSIILFTKFFLEFWFMFNVMHRVKRNDGGTGIYISFEHVLKEQFKTQELTLQSYLLSQIVLLLQEHLRSGRSLSETHSVALHFFCSLKHA